MKGPEEVETIAEIQGQDDGSPNQGSEWGWVQEEGVDWKIFKT